MFSGIWSDVSSKVRMESLSSDELFDQTIQVGKHSSPFGLCCIALAGGSRICALSFMDPDDAFSRSRWFSAFAGGNFTEERQGDGFRIGGLI